MTRTSCILSLILALSLPSLPALAEGISTDDVYACKDIASDSDRLACYDAAVGRLQQAEIDGDLTTMTRQEAEQVQKDSFGFSIPSLPAIMMRRSGDEKAQVKQVTMPVKAIRGSKGNLQIILENGQVWKQTDSKQLRNNGQKEALISEAALGSYKMKLDGGIAFRVERIK